MAWPDAAPAHRGGAALRVGSGMKVTIRQLQVFDAVATLGGVTRAADALGMSQSAVSSALGDFQIILRRPLFAHVKGRPLQITEEGRRLHPLVRSLLSGVQDLESPEGDAALSGRLIIGATAQVAETALPGLCVAFMKAHPAIDVQIEVETVGGLLERMKRFEIETALFEVLPDIQGIEVVRWRTDELVTIVASGHPLANRGPLRLADLAGHRWCTREAHSSITTQLRYLTNEALGPLPVGFQATSNWAVRHAVIAGGGIGFLSRALVQFDLDNGRLVQLDVEGLHFTRTINLARPRDIRRSRLHAAFDAHLIAHSEFAGQPID